MFKTQPLPKESWKEQAAGLCYSVSNERMDGVCARPHTIRKRISPKSVLPLTTKASSTLLVHFRGATCYM